MKQVRVLKKCGYGTLAGLFLLMTTLFHTNVWAEDNSTTQQCIGHGQRLNITVRESAESYLSDLIKERNTDVTDVYDLAIHQEEFNVSRGSLGLLHIGYIVRMPITMSLDISGETYTDVSCQFNVDYYVFGRHDGRVKWGRILGCNHPELDFHNNRLVRLGQGQTRRTIGIRIEENSRAIAPKSWCGPQEES